MSSFAIIRKEYVPLAKLSGNLKVTVSLFAKVPSLQVIIDALSPFSAIKLTLVNLSIPLPFNVTDICESFTATVVFSSDNTGSGATSYNTNEAATGVVISHTLSKVAAFVNEMAREAFLFSSS